MEKQVKKKKAKLGASGKVAGLRYPKKGEGERKSRVRCERSTIFWYSVIISTQNSAV